MKTTTILFALIFAAALNNGRAQDIWTQKEDFGGTGRFRSTGFSIGNKGYIGTGYDGTLKKDFWEYDPVANTWTQKADFGGSARYLAIGFSIGTKGYIGTGCDNSYAAFKDFWEYDPDANTWTPKAPFGGTPRYSATGFSIGNKGYIGTGEIYPNYYNDFWEYDPITNAWSQKADFGGSVRSGAVGFSIGTKGYLGTGSYTKDFWEYDPETNGWIQKADFEGGIRFSATGFSIDGKGYIGTGYDPSYKNDFWEYDAVTNDWTQKANLGGMPRAMAAGFSIGNKGYIGTGATINGYKQDFWEYSPEVSVPACIVPTSLSAFDISTTTAKLKWNGINGGLSYKIRYKMAGTSEWTIKKSIDHSKTLYGLLPETEYAWQVKSLCETNPVVSSNWSEKQFFTTKNLKLAKQVVDEMILHVYPNPVSSSATVSFFLNESSDVNIELLDLNGRIVSMIANKNFPAGNNEITFDRGSLSAGIYFLQLKTIEGVLMKKLAVIN